MSYKITYHIEIENDIIEAKDWYAKKLEGLDKRFLIEVKESINLIISDPLHFQIKFENVRSCFTKSFPFAIHYILDEEKDSIFILCVIHTSRKPEIWQKRIKK